MTLDAAEVLQATEIAQRTAAEAIRNLQRGTGGANMPIPVMRPGTVAANADAGDEVLVRPDGDANAVPAVNASGYALNAGQRVLISWPPPLGAYVTHILDRSQRGLWTPIWQGTGTNATNVVTSGIYYRAGDTVTVRGKMVFGSGSAVGTGLQMGGLPWPISTHGSGVPAHGSGHFWSGTNRQPLSYVVGEGQDFGDLQYYLTFAVPGGAVLTSPSSTAPFTWAAGAETNVSMTYETDAA